jgi:hypothetical protein
MAAAADHVALPLRLKPCLHLRYLSQCGSPTPRQIFTDASAHRCLASRRHVRQHPHGASIRELAPAFNILVLQWCGANGVLRPQSSHCDEAARLTY